MSKVKKLSVDSLKRFIVREAKKAGHPINEGDDPNTPKDLAAAAKKTKEVDADEYPNTLEKDIDHLAVLKVREAKARKYLKKIQEERKRIKKRVLNDK